MKETIETGEYFKQARQWYNEIYLLPLVYRSWITLMLGVSVFFLAALLVNIYLLFPMNSQIRYAITVENTTEYTADVTPAEIYGKDVYKSIAYAFLRTYIKIRESYDFDDMSDKLLFVKNTSTKVIFNQYNDSLSIDNPSSLVLKLQNYAKRNIYVKDLKVISDTDAIITFNARATEDNGKILEDSIFEAKVSFLMDQIDIAKPENSPFNFTVTDYKTKLLKDNNV